MADDNRKRIYQKVDEYLTGLEYGEDMAPDEAGFWEDRILLRIEGLQGGRTADQKDGTFNATAYRRSLLYLIADAVAAVEACDRRQKTESAEEAAS